MTRQFEIREKGFLVLMRKRSAEFFGHVRQWGKFSTMEELHDYFDDDKIICLLCGKACFQLAAHIVQAHDISADAYKEQFGIPWTCGLAGKPSGERPRFT